MSITLDRRQFLSLVSASLAAAALPKPLSAATPEQIESTWDALVADPWYFEINDMGALEVPGIPNPEIQSDVYDVCSTDITSTQQLIEVIDGNEELQWHFIRLAEGKAEELNNQEGALNRHQRKLLAAVQDHDWARWVKLEGRAGLAYFKAEIDRWRGSEVDWDHFESWDRCSTGQSAALSYFQDVDAALCRALGIVIVEGEFPGNSYYAAELRQDIGVANRTAAELALPFRFREGA